MKKFLSLLLLCATITLVSCETIDDSIPVSGITLNKTELLMIKDGKETLTATMAPENATDKQVTWESSDANVATVSENGEVTAVKEGTAVITATSVADNTQKATCTVTVAILPSEITLNKTTLLLPLNAKETLAATVAPENATDKKVTWESSDANVATVSETGEVTAVKEGTAVITATSVADNTKKAACKVIIGIFPSGVTLNKTNLWLILGAKETLLATVAPEDSTDKQVTWESSDASVATVSATGEVTALKKGTATITAKTVDVTKTASCVVTVVDETNAKCKVVNDVTPVTSVIGANGTMYETSVIFYSDSDEAGVASVGDVSPEGGQSSTIPSLAGATRVRVSFKLLPSTNTSPVNARQYTVDYFVLQADALTTITITGNTMLTTTKGLMRGVSETMTFREALSRL